VFGRIYEYFLMQFAGQKAHDDGEFFTPPSLVQTIVNVIEPVRGKVFDPACGSGGMFVQTSHFIESKGEDTAKKVIFYGQEKTDTTIKLAKMNLAVHGLEGNIRDANTFEEDAFTLVGKCDYVMANPPFNVDMVSADKVKGDKRLPFGLPGVNKDKKVSNGNYLWISYFYSYLNETGRAGFVMSSQASSAGHGEKEVRRKIVETGDVDVMIGIRSNFFYTRPVPCELWFFDKNKPKALKDKVLMLDARNVYRKVSRRIYDFSPEQLNNLSAIVWLYRGQTDRFLKIITDYFEVGYREAERVQGCLGDFDKQVEAVTTVLGPFQKATEKLKGLDEAKSKALSEAQTELGEALKAYAGDRKVLLDELTGYLKKIKPKTLITNKVQHDVREVFDPIADSLKGLVKQVDLVYKLAVRASDNVLDLAGDEKVAELLDRRGLGRLLKDLDGIRKQSVEQLKLAGYFHKQVVWLHDRFPKAELESVPGLVKLVNKKDIEKADWSLTPGRYVGVAPQEEDDDFDFEQVISDIHTELANLNDESIQLAKRIQNNIETIK
jgi:type I restriction enzyme M protein